MPAVCPLPCAAAQLVVQNPPGTCQCRGASLLRVLFNELCNTCICCDAVQGSSALSACQRTEGQQLPAAGGYTKEGSAALAGVGSIWRCQGVCGAGKMLYKMESPGSAPSGVDHIMEALRAAAGAKQEG